MLRQFETFIIRILDTTDPLLSPLGFYAGVLIAIAFIIGSVILAGQVLSRVYYGSLLRRAIVIVLAFPLTIIAVLIVWRLLRYAAGYIANSPLPWSLIF